MTKLFLSDVANLQNESTVVTTLKQNNDSTEAALENTLSRDGSSPNQMLADFDMNNNRIINLPDATTDQEPATFSQLIDYVTAVGEGAVLDAPYVTLATDTKLQNERVLSVGTGLTLTDTGAGGSVTIGVDNPTLDSATTTLTNKTIDTAGPNTIKINGNTLAATAGTATVTVPNSTDTLVARATTDTLSNKTLDNTTVETIKDGNLTLQNSTDTTKQAKFDLSSITTGTTNTFTFPPSNGTLLTTGSTNTVANKTFNDTNNYTTKANAFTLEDQTDTTKKGLFSIASVTTGTTRTYTLPNASDTIIGRATTDTLSNKTIDTASANTLKINGNTLAATAGTATLTVPNSTDTLVGRATTDTLTNKTISGASNTLSNIANSSLTNSSITLGVTSIPLGGTVSAPTARNSAVLNIDQLTGRGDANYTILSTDRHVFTNANFTASRTWTLPAANAVNPGQRLIVADLQGTVTSTNTLIVAAAGTDTINGSPTVALSSANTSVELISDGTSKWYAVQSSSGGSGGTTAVAPNQFEFVSTAGQSTFTGTDQNGKNLVYTVNNIEVFYNGLKLTKSDYTANTTSSVVLSSAITTKAGDSIQIMDFGAGPGVSSFRTYEFLATAGQTTFSGTDANALTLSYTPSAVLVYANGDLLNNADYTANTGTSIVFPVGRALNDQIKIIAMNQSAMGLIPNNNLSDVTNVATARTNLGLGTGHVAGITNGSAAAAGEVGEVISTAISSAIGTSATATLLGSITLTAGDWDVSALLQWNASTGTTAGTDWYSILSTTSTPSILAANSISNTALHNRVPSTADYSGYHAHPPYTINVSSTTTIYAHGSVTITAGASFNYIGWLRARRMR